METIKVLIIEDDPDWLKGLTAYLSKQPDIQIVGQASDVEEAIKQIAKAGFDVVLMDIMLANQAEGIWLTSEVCQKCQASVIMLTSMEEKELIFEAFQAGAIDYQIKSDYEKLPQAIRSAFDKQAPINSSVAEQMRAEFRRLKVLEKHYQVKEIKDIITPTEMEILEHIDRGYTQTDIAKKFVISIHTVKVHVGNVLRKLGGQSSKESARKLRDLGVFKKDETEESNKL
jgi:two-component system vancomycin resistance associated response regulator VraR